MKKQELKEVQISNFLILVFSISSIFISIEKQIQKVSFVDP